MILMRPCCPGRAARAGHHDRGASFSGSSGSTPVTVYVSPFTCAMWMRAIFRLYDALCHHPTPKHTEITPSAMITTVSLNALTLFLAGLGDVRPVAGSGVSA